MLKYFIILFTAITVIPHASSAQGIDPWKNRSVISVIDGDSAVLDNGEVIKLIGLLAPKAKHGKQEGEPYGEQSRLDTEEFLLGQSVEIGFDPAYGPNGHRDKYGRALVYITITRGAEKRFANLELLQRGTGYLAPIPSSLQFADILKTGELVARKNKTGVWKTAEKSPIEIAASAGKGYEESPPAVNMIYIRPTVPILQSGGSAAVAQQTPQPSSDNGKKASLAMDDLRQTKAIEPKKPEKKIDPDEALYDLKERKTLVTYYDDDKKLEFYKATLTNTSSDYRVAVKQGDKEVTFITNYDGIKSFGKLLAKGTDSQPMLTAVETNVGSISGMRGSINVSSGKDGGLFLNVNGKEGSSRVFITRINALSLQIRIGNLIP